MALKLFPIPFPIVLPPPNSHPYPNPTPSQPNHRPPSEVRFSRWNNANAEKFNQRRRTQQEIEDDIRRNRRFNSATNIASNYDFATSSTNTETFKSIGTPSSPSSPSIPGKKSKYSKPETRKSHPAFRRVSRITKVSPPQEPIDRNANISLSEDGVSYVIDGAPFEFKYSYTETPKAQPMKLREPPFSPFGPTTMPRPWTGRAPLPPSKKKLKEFDSFELPPPHKKGVKPVQAPGPFLPGSGPRYVKTREEILGEPLTQEEIKDLVDGCLRSKRQLNMGRDGLTHNMLDNIHAHWKRRRVCKIKCKGVCTVDIENVCQQLEERTGGKIIYRKGGVLYLFRGRNYNYRTQPRFPLMLWKPITPVYPRLIQRSPEGLTLEEAAEMRKKGRKLIPICKLGKNGVYDNLVKHVREAFEECELVRINCQGMNGSDYRKIGAKLKELVPCVLISFECEHILMWRGRDWRSSFIKQVNDCEEAKESSMDCATWAAPPLEGQEIEMLSVKDVIKPVNICKEAKELNFDSVTSTAPPIKDQEVETLSVEDVCLSALNMNTSVLSSEEQREDESAIETHTSAICERRTTSGNAGSSAVTESEAMSNMNDSGAILNDSGYANELTTTALVRSDTMIGSVGSMEELQNISEDLHAFTEPSRLGMTYAEGVLQLLQQAVESGSAVVLDDANLDADIVYQRVVAFARSAPPGPVFRHRPRKAVAQKYEKQESGDLEVEVATVSDKGGSVRKSSKLQRTKKFNEQYVDVVPQGSLRLDELANLLA